MLIKAATSRWVLSPLAYPRSRLVAVATCKRPGPQWPQWRTFGSGSKRRNGSTRAVEPLAVTWLAPNPSVVTADHIVPNLPILPPTSDRQQNVLVFFSTPAFAPWMDESHSFLKESIQHIFQDAHGPACVHDEFQAVVAVVDKLPSPPAWFEKATKNISAQGEGSEGLSMLLVDRKYLTGEIAKELGGRSSHPSEPSITYSVKPPGEGGRFISHSVGLRLANTLFVNGNHRTMFASSWRHDRTKDDLILQRRIDLSGCHITSMSEPTVDMEVPLHAVTSRRKVLFSMGNILRQISEGDESDLPVPASSELEKELPRYVKENNLTNQRLAVWALVEPPIESGADLGTDMDASRIPHSLRSGARLHRVVSGGGGWGKKQGLLSLDPEDQFTGDSAAARPIVELLEDESADSKKNAASDASSPPGFPNFGEEPEITSINQLAKDGEFVQFFVAPEGESTEAETNSVPSASSDKGAVDPTSSPTVTCTFGAISSSDDVIPTIQEAEVPPESSPEGSNESCPVIPLKNYFGALSEKGITYSSFACPGTSLSKDSEQTGRRISHTKMSVPGARVRFV